MKRYLKIISAIFLTSLLSSFVLLAQSPEAMYYQAEARDSKGHVIHNKNLDVKITILADHPSGTVCWEGTHHVTTDKYGYFSLTIGEGSGGSYNFSAIDWANHAHFLNVKVFYKNIWTDMGTTQFLSVPYAFHAKTAETVAFDQVEDADADPTNELQDWNSLPGIPEDISDGDDVDDADADPLNEIQDLQLDGNILTITRNNSAAQIDLGAYLIDTDTHLTEAEVDAMVDNNGYLTEDNDDQTLQLSGHELSIEDGNAVTLPDEVNDADANPLNEIQDLQLDGNILTITMNNASTEIDLGAYLDDTDTHLTEAEVDAMVGNNGFLTEESDDQTLQLSGHELSIEDGNAVTLPDEVNDADPDPTNELVSSFVLNGSNVELSDAGGTKTVNLGSLEGDFSDGGDAAGSDRSLGNTSNHALSFITNNANRLHIRNSGNIGIGTVIPSQRLEVAGTIYSSSGGFKFPDGTVQVSASTGGGAASRINDLIDGKTSFYSVYLGANAGANNDGSGYRYSTALGYDALSSSSSGARNSAMGYEALKSNTIGSYNVGIGSQAMESNTSGNSNVSIGRDANRYNGSGSGNTIIGDRAGRGTGLHHKSGNVFLGFNAGYFETGSNLLYIDNSSTSLPLIWGDFSQDKIKINGSMDVSSSFKAAQIQLSSGAHNGYVLTSDASGNASWQSLSSSPWTVSGYDVYRFSGNVGIGTNQPSFRLDVNGNMRVNGSVRADKLLIPATTQYYSIAGCTFTSTGSNSYYDSRSISYIAIHPNTAWGDADLVAPVHIPSGATLENISARVLDNGPAAITVSLYLIAYNGGWFNLGSTNSSINSSAVQNMTGSLSSTVDNSNNAYVAVVRCYGTYSTSQYYRIYKVTIRYSISALP